MDRQRYLFLFSFIISIALLFSAWQKEQAEKALAVSASSPATIATASVAAKSANSIPVVASPAPATVTTTSTTNGVPVVNSAATPSPALPAAPAPHINPERIKIETDLYIAYVNTLGGVLESIEFKAHRSSQDKSKLFHYLKQDADHVHIAQTGLTGQGLPNHNTQYIPSAKSLTLQQNQNEMILTLTPAVPSPGAVIQQQWIFHRDSYVIDSAYTLQNKTALPWVANAYFQLERDNKPPAGQARFVSSFTGVGVYNEADKYHKLSFEDIHKQKATFNTHPSSGWIGMVEHYFVAAWLVNPNAHLGTPEFFARATTADRVAAGLVLTQTIQPQQQANIRVPLYVGPQEQEKMALIAPGLDLTVDYGIFTVVAVPIFKFLKLLHGVLGNWGWAILAMTFLLKLVFFPLNRSSAYSMAKTKLLTPRIEQIRAQYKEDPVRMQKEIITLYKKEKVNPAGGCLPILIQIPIFIALYWVLLSAVELRHAPWIGWIQDLSAADPYYILPILYGLTSFIQVKVSPKPASPTGNESDALILQYMPVAFSVMFIFFPSGMLLYWVLNNTLTILQQWHVNRGIERRGLNVKAA
ncbi:MAG: membrane protein insertase YidC [Pseudomonadota bacterium]